MATDAPDPIQPVAVHLPDWVSCDRRRSGINLGRVGGLFDWWYLGNGRTMGLWLMHLGPGQSDGYWLKTIDRLRRSHMRFDDHRRSVLLVL